MIRKAFVTLLFFVISILTVQAQEKTKIFSNMDVFELEWAADPQISPDGSRIAFASSAEGNGSEIYVYWLDSGAMAHITQLERLPDKLSWSPDGNHIAFSMHVPESNPVLVKPPKKPKGAKWAENPRVTTRLNHEADGTGYLEPGFSHLFVVPAEGGTARQITSGDYNHDGKPVWTPGGKSLIFSANRHEDWAYNRRNSEVYSVSIEGGTITLLTDREGPDYSPALSPDGKTIAFLGYDDKKQTYQIANLYTMNPDGSSKKQINLNLDRDISNLVWDEEGDGLYFMYDDEGNTKIGHTDLSGNATRVASDVGGTAVGRPYGGGSFSVSDDGRIAMNQTTPNYPAELAVTEMGQDEADKITDLNGDLLDFRQLGKTEEIWYESSVDERKILGWIVKPPSFDSTKSYPMIVENHGGPISNYGDRFSPEIQLYASAGYVVFYPNPRGSTGYGEEFGNLLYHDYPGDDYHDVMDGVDAVIAQGYVSEDSLYVTDGSAGGIMTAWIIGKTNRFRSAAVVKPVMNWISKTLTADNYYGYAYYRYPGQPWGNFEEYWKYSPISLVGNVQTPTLVMVGRSDLRTPPSEAKQLYHALKLRKIETALVEIPGSYHFISNRPSQLIAKVNHVLAWFEK